MYSVRDRSCHVIRMFDTEGQAQEFCFIMGRSDWRVERVRPTKSQVRAVHFCEMVLDIKFEGNIHNLYDIEEFLDNYLEDAKIIMEDAESSYSENIDYVCW